ncbi:MAG: M15 family metallopeptidase [Fimbriimonadaceae bacterium]
MSQKKPSPAEPVTELRRIPILECGEPLVSYLGQHPRLIEAAPRWDYVRATFARQSVVQMLVKAAEALPKQYAIAVVEGWRPPYIQRRLYLSSWERWKAKKPDWSDAQLRRTVNRYTAPIHKRVPPPHSTGGAVDLVLALQDGTELDHMSPYEFGHHEAYPFDAPGLNEESRKNRDALAKALLAGGLTNYPSEWWHWSYGDQGWAYRNGLPNAIYGPTEPEGWLGREEDMVEAPLTRFA